MNPVSGRERVIPGRGHLRVEVEQLLCEQLGELKLGSDPGSVRFQRGRHRRDQMNNLGTQKAVGPPGTSSSPAAVPLTPPVMVIGQTRQRHVGRQKHIDNGPPYARAVDGELGVWRSSGAVGPMRASTRVIKSLVAATIAG